jgi:phthalate 4,5-dioxygenase
MLSRAENELITQVGAGTPMGNALRRYWFPAVRADEVSADGTPLRIRLLGEDLIAFRDTSGAAGLIEAFCPHRRAPMFFGRNEEHGLRCVYHGWKFDVTGRCTDMPSEPPDSLFKDKVRIGAYPCRERNGVVWTYMGSSPELPELPELEWNLVPAEQRYITKRVQYCNFVQALEGGIDPSHVPFLHGTLERDPANVFAQDLNPRFELLETAYGLRIGTCRRIGKGRVHWNITHFMMPFYNAFAVPNGAVEPTVGGFAWVPMDDTTTMAWCFTWNPARPLAPEEIDERGSVARLGGGVHLRAEDLLPPTSEPGGAWRPIGSKANDYLLDREAQRTRRFAGVPGLSLQDVSLQEGMGPVSDRSREHLGTSDAAIINARRLLLRAARATTPVQGRDAPRSYRVRALGVPLAPADDWTAAAADWIEPKVPAGL